LARVETVVFDKTGTLTKGIFEVQEIHAIGMTEDALLEYAAYAEHHSNHPLSLSLKEAYGREIDATRIEKVEELSGHGMSVVLDGRRIKVGNARLMRLSGIESVDEAARGTVVHVAVGGAYAGYILIADEVKEDSRALIKALKAMGLKQTVMLTGDTSSVGLAVGAELGIDTTYSELLPGDKVEKLEELLAGESKRGTLAFVGDGINDAPVIARADIGIAMGAMGSDAAIEAADIVIMTDEPSKIASAIRIAKKTLRIASQNIWFALSVKFIVLILSALGIATMWEAVFADVGVTILAVLNAFRALSTKGL
jgi:Cd2+/Zn2+-exporting ATPase